MRNPHFRHSQRSLAVACLLMVALAVSGCAPVRRAVQRKACKVCAGDSTTVPVRFTVIERDTVAPQVVTGSVSAAHLVQWLRPWPGLAHDDTLRIEDNNPLDGRGHILLVRHDTTIYFKAVCDTVFHTDTIGVDTFVKVMVPCPPPVRSWWEGTAGGIPRGRGWLAFFLLFPWSLVAAAAVWLYRLWRKQRELFKNPLTLFRHGNQDNNDQS